jgi:hypothetical protein
MSSERRYRLLLLSYPRSYRAERAEEMLDVLLAAEEDRGSRSGPAEAVSLVGHGLALRLRRPVVGPQVSPSLSLAGVSVLCVLAVLGAHQLLAAGLRGLGLDGHPEVWRLYVLWVDPLWPVQVLWVAAGTALLLGRHRFCVASAWAAAALHAWHFLVTAVTSVALPWPGDIGPHWVASGGTAEAGWLVLSVAGAFLLGGPARVAGARAALSPRGLRSVAAVGLVGVGLAAVAGPAAYSLRGHGALALADTVRGPAAAVVLIAAVLCLLLTRAPHGRGALVLLGVLAMAPLGAHWTETMTVLAAGALVFAAGYAVASRRRPSSAGCRTAGNRNG